MSVVPIFKACSLETGIRPLFAKITALFIKTPPSSSTIPICDGFSQKIISQQIHDKTIGITTNKLLNPNPRTNLMKVKKSMEKTNRFFKKSGTWTFLNNLGMPHRPAKATIIINSTVVPQLFKSVFVL